MSSSDLDRQARKFLEQLRVRQAELAALYEELLDPESGALRAEFDHLTRVLANSEVDRKRLQRELLKARRQLEAVGATDVDPASTRHQLRDAIRQARVKLKNGYADEALAILEKAR